MILGDDGPVVGQQFDVAFAGVDHGFDSDRHAGLERHPGPRQAVMQNLRVFVELSADTVAAVFLYNRELPGFRIGLNGMPNVTQTRPGADHVDSEQQALISGVHQSPGSYRRLSYAEHLAGIAVIIFFYHGDVYIDYVAVFQAFISGNAMADHVVDGCADRLGKPAIVQWRRYRIQFIDDVLVADSVKFVSGDACLDVRLYHCEHRRSQGAGDAHFLYLIPGF